jgi:hypothetical protein
MDVSTIISLIGSVGFPIVACVGMFYLYDRTLKDFTASLKSITIEIGELREDFKELSSELKDCMASIGGKHA